VSHICWYVDRKTNEGTCVAFCIDQEDPTCDDPDTMCMLNGDGVLILCLPLCDPLMQDCPAGEACYPIPGERYACAPDITDGEGLFGEPCSALNGCAPGFFCGDGQSVPDCSESACCNAFCDLNQPNTCPGAGQVCVPMFENPPPGMEHVGRCSLPN
jgi:hypothetical protein